MSLECVLLGEEKKLDSFVLVAALGFESMGGTITSNQFIYCPEESKPNIYQRKPGGYQ